MGHISHDAGFKRTIGSTLKLSVMKSSDQFQVALRWFGRGHDPRRFGQSEGKQLVTLHISWKRFTTPFWMFKKYASRPSWVAKLNFGMGAGYIGGATVFVGRRTKGGRVNYAKYPTAAYVLAPVRFGVTRNANAVPYPNW